MKYASIALLASAQAIVKREPWDKDSLPDCPEDKDRIIMDDAETHVVKFPYVGATCQMQVGRQSLAMVEPVAWDRETLPDCPEDEARTRMDDNTHVSQFPNVGATCKLQIGDMSLVRIGADPAGEEAKKVAEPAAPAIDYSVLKGLEHCPDFNERFTLVNGRTRAIKYPNAGYNCSDQYGLVQGPESELGGPKVAGKKPAAAPKKAAKKPAAPEVPRGTPNLDHLEHCPDFNERYTLVNGQTIAIAYPKAGFNCNPAWSLVQQATPWPQNVVPANDPSAAKYPAGLEHCPDRPERQTLRDGLTKPIAFPAKDANCKPDIYPAQAGVPFPYALAALQKATPWPQNVVPANDAAVVKYPAGLEHCPDRPERQTLRDGLTKPIAFPAKDANCKPDIYPGVEGVPAPYH